MEGVFGFLRFVHALKRVKRAGWLRSLTPEKVESVCDHSFGVAAHFLALSDEELVVDGFKASRAK